MAAVPDKVNILVVGGGPVGLTAALSLWKSGFKDVFVLDDSSGTASNDKQNSRAAVIHAGTLEVLDRLGCVKPFLQEGTPTRYITYTDQSSIFLRADFNTLAAYTKYPYCLLIPQGTSEDILEAQAASLGVSVYRNQKVTGLKFLDSAGFEVSLESGQTVRADHVIGADGARSAIRSLSGMVFKNPNTGILHNDPAEISRSPCVILADVTFRDGSVRFPLGATVSSSSLGLAIMIGPMPDSYRTLRGLPEGENLYRIGFGLPNWLTAVESPPKHPSTEQLQEYLDYRGRIFLSSSSPFHTKPPTIARTLWAGRFRIGNAVVDDFLIQHNSGENFIFLAGDAAHVHPPAGGQGANLGIRDAAGLGPAFAAYSAGNKDALRNYATKRRRAALNTIRKAGMLFYISNALINPKNFLVKLALLALRVAGRFSAVKRMFSWQLSGLADVDN